MPPCTGPCKNQGDCGTSEGCCPVGAGRLAGSASTGRGAWSSRPEVSRPDRHIPRSAPALIGACSGRPGAPPGERPQLPLPAAPARRRVRGDRPILPYRIPPRIPGGALFPLFPKEGRSNVHRSFTGGGERQIPSQKILCTFYRHLSIDISHGMRYNGRNSNRKCDERDRPFRTKPLQRAAGR